MNVRDILKTYGLKMLGNDLSDADDEELIDILIDFGTDEDVVDVDEYRWYTRYTKRMTLGDYRIEYTDYRIHNDTTMEDNGLTYDVDSCVATLIEE